MDPDTGGTAPICASAGRNQHIDGATERASKATRDRSGEPAENRAGTGRVYSDPLPLHRRQRPVVCDHDTGHGHLPLTVA